MWGLFILSILLFCTTGMISAGRMHLYLPLLHHRDYSAPAGFIPTLLFCSTEIISAGRMHLYLPLLLHKDYFRRPNASLSSSFAPQGWFPPVKCISNLLFSSTGIISAARMHLYLALFLHRDDFAPVRCVSSLRTSLSGHSVNFRFKQFSTHLFHCLKSWHLVWDHSLTHIFQ